MNSFAELRKVFIQKQNEQLPPIPKRLINKPFFKDTQNGVFGVYKPDPVDREAAMMLSKSRWKNAPEIKKEKKKMSDKRIKMQNIHESMTGDSSPVFMKTGADGEAKIKITDLALMVASQIEANLPNKMSKLAVYVCDSRDAIDKAMENIGCTMEEFDRRVTSAMDSIRSKRMSIVSEASLATNALKDVRQFFLGKDYEDEKNRLSEFVELCERLQKLKESGFLDVVADTMIRLDR